METAFRNQTNGTKHFIEKYHVWCCGRKPDQEQRDVSFWNPKHTSGWHRCVHIGSLPLTGFEVKTNKVQETHRP